MEAWGFRYVTVPFYWVKTNCKNGENFRGPGRYIPSNMEPVLLGTRGKGCWHPNTGYKPIQEIREPHPRHNGKIIHSRKPATLHKELVKWLGPHIGDYGFLELFATIETDGWKCLGHSISGLDIEEELIALSS